MSEPRTPTRKPTRKVAASKTEHPVSREEIAQRAYEIAHGPDAGSDEENWLRAEQELSRR